MLQVRDAHGAGELALEVAPLVVEACAAQESHPRGRHLHSTGAVASPHGGGVVEPRHMAGYR